MAVAQGYGKTVTSGSVFAYDTGDTRNSYIGQPTTNLEASNIDTTFETIADGNTAGFNNQLGSGNYLGVSSTMGYKSSKSLKINRGTGGTGRIYKTYSVSTGQYSSVSCWVYSTTAGPYLALEYFGGDYSWGVSYTNNTHTGTGWELLYVRTTGPATSNTTAYYFLYPSIQNQDIYLDNIQTELKQYPTSFVNGTRSATQGLLPLVGNSTIDLSNVSFDSSAKMVFDGTDDLIDITTNFGTLSAYTFEYVAYANSGGNMPIASRTNTNFYKYGAYSWRYTHGGVGGEFYHNYGNDTGWAHWVITYDGSTISVWENGVSKGTSSSSGTADFSGGIRIGSWASSAAYTWDGTIPVMKMYNRALTAQEVKQNFDFYDARFGLDVDTYYFAVSNRFAQVERRNYPGGTEVIVRARNMATTTPAYILYQKPDASKGIVANYTEIARDDIGSPTRLTIFGYQTSYSNGRYLTSVTVRKSRKSGRLFFEFPDGGTSQYGEAFYRSIITPHVP